MFRERFGNGGRQLAEPEKGLLFGWGDVIQREATTRLSGSA
ncbi:hypothetical protein [Streptomyces sp. NPDC001020]